MIICEKNEQTKNTSKKPAKKPAKGNHERENNCT